MRTGTPPKVVMGSQSGPDVSATRRKGPGAVSASGYATGAGRVVPRTAGGIPTKGASDRSQPVRVPMVAPASRGRNVHSPDDRNPATGIHQGLSVACIAGNIRRDHRRAHEVPAGHQRQRRRHRLHQALAYPLGRLGEPDEVPASDLEAEVIDGQATDMAVPATIGPAVDLHRTAGGDLADGPWCRLARLVWPVRWRLSASWVQVQFWRDA